MDRTDVLRLHDIDLPSLQRLLGKYSIELIQSPAHEPIPGSFWGDSEAGLIDNRIYARPDTPLHSILHEACHYICMDRTRRNSLHTDAGGDYEEENGVCYLQILLADDLPQMGKARMLQDMDDWGYTFRFGSAQRWFEEDAEDARQWLVEHGLITRNLRPAYKLRS